MHALIEKLIKNGPVITDGAWGTELQSRGLQPGKSPESWNLDHPDQVQEVPAAYVQAGSHIVLTNTFGANHFVQKKNSSSKVRFLKSIEPEWISPERL